MKQLMQVDFLVVGAQKSGTTSLHDWLTQQPDVILPSLKETHFFSHDERFALGADWYAKQFKLREHPDPLVGEIDPEYMFSEKAVKRIATYTDVKKVIFILRFPLDRAYSHYQMSVRRAYETLSFKDALKEESVRLASGELFALDHHSYLARGLYAGQIERFMESVPHAEYKFIRFEDLIDPVHGVETYASICQFIGVKSSPEIADRSKSSNRASEPRFGFIRNQIYKGGWLKRVAGKVVPSGDFKLRIAMWVDKLNQKPLHEKKSYGLEDIPESYLEEIRSDISKTQAMTGLDLSEWKNRIDMRNKPYA